jgi:hypothetical protein
MAKRQRKPRSGVESPTSDCVLLCDDVVVSQGKNKHTLVGIIGGIGVPRFPAVIGGYVTYVRLSNVYGGGQKITLRFSFAATDETIMETEARFPANSDPLGVYTLVAPIPQFVVAIGGRYIFGAYHNGVPIATSPILINGPVAEKDE